MSWTKTKDYATIDNNSERLYHSNKLVSAGNFLTVEYSANPAGTIFNSTVSGPYTTLGVTMGAARNRHRERPDPSALAGLGVAEVIRRSGSGRSSFR